MRALVLSKAYMLESPGKLTFKTPDFISLCSVLGIIFKGSPGDPKVQLGLRGTELTPCSSSVDHGWHRLPGLAL